MTKPDLTPTELNQHLKQNPQITTLALDTETSGLYGDDGARPSTISLAWEYKTPPTTDQLNWLNQWGNLTHGPEKTHPTQPPTYIASIAWPFDQGTDGKQIPGSKLENSDTIPLFNLEQNQNEQQWDQLTDLLKKHQLIYQNAKFDLEKMRLGLRQHPNKGIELEQNTAWDTMLASQLLWPGETTALKPTCARIFGKQWEDESTKVRTYLKKHKLPTGRWDLIPWEIISPYANTDARITLMLYLHQQTEIQQHPEKQQLQKLMQRRLETMQVLYRMERRGIPYDKTNSRLTAKQIRESAKQLANQLPFGNGNEATENQAKTYFFTNKPNATKDGKPGRNYIPYALTNKGQPSMTAEVLQQMIKDQIPYAQEYAEYTKAQNAASMWYEAYAEFVGTDNRLRTYFRQLGTKSGRFSVERVNLQAIPRDYRLEGYQILDGITTPRQLISNAVANLTNTKNQWRLFELDLAQAELRIAALYAKCETMLDMIKNNQDLHTYTTEQIFPEIKQTDSDFDMWRQIGKRANFSLCFGAGARTFAAMIAKETGIQLSENEAHKTVRNWNALYPEFARASEKHMNIIQRRANKHPEGRAHIKLPNGEHRWFAPGEETHKAFNQRVQSALAQYAIDWMLATEKWITEQNPQIQQQANQQQIGEVGLVLVIHDSQLLLLPNNPEGEHIAAQAAETGKKLWQQWFPGINGNIDYHAW